MSPRPATLTTRFVQKFIDLGEIRLHFAEVTGDGPPLILVHGIGMDWRVFQAISRRLQPYFHLYLLDLRGHGESDKPEHGYTLPHYAADVEEFLDALNLKGVVLAGSSLGGMVTATVEAPADLVSHRVLIDPPLTGGPVRDPSNWEEIRRLKHGSRNLLADYLQLQNPGMGRYLALAMSDMWAVSADGVINDMLADGAHYFDVDKALRLIDAPTLVMRANRALGGVLTEEWARHALSELPHGTEVYFPGAGHAIHAYQPAEFTRVVLEFTGVMPAEGKPASAL